jgi:hypothetical protein
VTTALKYGSEAPDPHALDAITSGLRANKLHYLLMAHVFWYIRDKDIMQKVGADQPGDGYGRHCCNAFHLISDFMLLLQVVSTWTKKSADSKDPKLRPALLIKMWLMRISKDRFQTPEIKRATTVILHSTRFTRKKNSSVNVNVSMNETIDNEHEEADDAKNDIELNAQETSCLSAIAALQWWVQIDPNAAADIEAEFIRFAFRSLIENVEVTPQYSNESIFVMDVAKSMANILALVRRQANDVSKPQLFGKTGFRSVYLSKLLSPGQLVKDVKVALTDALLLEGEDHAALEASLDDFSASVDISFTHSSIHHRSCQQTSVVNGVFENGCGGFSQIRNLEDDSVCKMPVIEARVMSFSNQENLDVITSSLDENHDLRGAVASVSTANETKEQVVKVPSVAIKLVDAPHRRSTLVVTPRLPKGELIEGRIPPWQEDLIKHQRGKEHAQRMEESRRAERAAVGLPSPPKGQKASHRFQRHRRPSSSSAAAAPQAGVRGRPPPSSVDAELSVVSAHSFVDNCLGNSLEALSVDKSPTRGSKATAPASLIGDSIETLSPTKERVSPSKRVMKGQGPEVDSPLPVPEEGKKSKPSNRFRSGVDDPPTRPVREGWQVRGGVQSRPKSTKSRPTSTSSQQVIITPGAMPISLDRSIDDDSAGDVLCRPQTFALQMINELTELKGRGDQITPEESERLLFINRAINAIIEQESSMVNDISSRLESIKVESESNINNSTTDHFTTRDNARDPLTSYYYSLHPPPQADATVTNILTLRPTDDIDQMISYKKYDAYHRDKNVDVLSELLSLDF